MSMRIKPIHLGLIDFSNFDIISPSELQMSEQFSQQIHIITDGSLITNENKSPQIINESVKSLHNDSSILAKLHESLKPSPSGKTSMLPKLHAGYFRICVSLGGQALLWKTLSEQHINKSRVFHHAFTMFPSTAFLFVWWLAFCTLAFMSVLYILKCIFNFKMVKAEFSDHVGVNYLFTPWISWLLLLPSAPFDIPKTHQLLWLVFVAPVIILDVKIYGQWFTTEKRFFSMFANPTSQMSVIGNLVGAWVAAKMGWRESALFIFTLGASHYLVVFITLYQRLSAVDQLPATMRPVFFLFVAAPSMGSLAWNSINEEFDTTCKMLFFLSIFLFISLVCRPALFKKSMKKFSLAWWAYSFPLTFLALASTEYNKQVKGMITMGITLVLSVFSVVVFLSLMVFTVLNTDKLLREDDPTFRFKENLATTAKVTKC